MRHSVMDVFVRGRGMVPTKCYYFEKPEFYAKGKKYVIVETIITGQRPTDAIHVCRDEQGERWRFELSKLVDKFKKGVIHEKP